MLFGNNSTVGIDLGTTGMRAVEVNWKNSHFVVERWVAVDFDTEITDWPVVEAEGLGRVIRTALEQQGFKGTWAAHSVGGESVAPQYFNFPKLLPEDIAEAVRIEVEAGLPFRVEDALISYILFPDQCLGASQPASMSNSNLTLDDEAGSAPATPADGQAGPTKSRTHGMAIAADSTFVESRLEILRKAGLEPFCVETDATACGNAFLATGDAAALKGTAAILNIGHRYSNLAILNEGTLLVRDLPYGGAQVTKAIAEALSIKEDEAEALKRAHWEKGAAGAEPLGERMMEVLEMNLQELLDRLKDSVQYWVGERLVPGLGHVLLTGGGSQVRELPDLLSNTLGVPVERWCPVKDAMGKDDERRAPWESRLSVAFGLALRKFPKKGS